MSLHFLLTKQCRSRSRFENIETTLLDEIPVSLSHSIEDVERPPRFSQLHSTFHGRRGHVRRKTRVYPGKIRPEEVPPGRTPRAKGVQPSARQAWADVRELNRFVSGRRSRKRRGRGGNSKGDASRKEMPRKGYEIERFSLGNPLETEPLPPRLRHRSFRHK